MKDKKGMAMNMLVSIVLTVIAFMFIAGTIARFMSSSNDVEAEVLCQSSIGIRAATTINTLGSDVKLAPVLCKTLDKEISGSRTEVMQQMADKMARCWWMFGEGRYKKDIFNSIDIFGGSAHCFQCSSLLVESIDNYESSDSITPKEFADYLRNTKYPKTNGTYLDYIQSYGGQGYIASVLTPAGIAPGRAYAVAFKPVRDTCPKCWITNLGASAGLLVGTGLMFIPLGVTQVAGVVILSSSAAVGATSSYNTVRDVFDSGPNINTIYLVDMNQETLGTVFGESCVRVDDIAGK